MIYSENILICLALPLAVTFFFIRGKERANFTGLVLGMIMCLLGAYLNSFFADIFDYDQAETAKYISPMVEEIMKMAPIVLCALLTQIQGKELMNYAVAVGAGFATFENCCYITENGAQLVSFVLVRGLAVGVMHVLCGIVFGIGINLAMKHKAVMIPGMISAFAFAMTIHALYNLLVSATGMYMYIGFGFPMVIIFLVYHTKDKAIEISD